MRIEHAGQIYNLGFKRWLPEHHTFPSTSASLYLMVREVDATGAPLITGWEEVATAQVGCHHGDDFSKEQGRRFALKKLALTIGDRTLRGKVMNAYFNRSHRPDPKALRSQIADLQEALASYERQGRHGRERRKGDRRAS